MIADTVLARWLTPGGLDADPAPRGWLQSMLLGHAPADGSADRCSAIERLDEWPNLASITAPTLVIGAQDPATPSEHQQAIVYAVPGARLEILDVASAPRHRRAAG